MRIKAILYIFSLSLIILSCSSYVYSQELSAGETEVRAEAEKYFSAGEFDKALPLYSQLLSIDSKSHLFNYRYGVCLLETKTNCEKALDFLNFSMNGDVTDKVYYYIGRAYHLTYRFDDAISFYKQFSGKVDNSVLEELAVDWKITMCENGKELINYISELKVLENKSVKDEKFYRSYDLEDFGGDIIVKTDQYISKIDKKMDYKGLMFYSNEKGVIYYASYGDSKKSSLDIYRIERSGTGEWLPAEKLDETINTPYDEDFPFIHPDGKTLYFCSKGHNSMGGYDIFKSTYDEDMITWSKPINLDFPTNSPYDDILYITDGPGDYAYFASDRENFGDEISVYKIEIEKNPLEKVAGDIEEIRSVAKLDVLLVDNTDSGTNGGMLEVDLSNQIESETSIIFVDIEPTEISKPSDFHIAAKEDAKKVKESSVYTRKEANMAYLIAYAKDKEANDIQKEADILFRTAQEIAAEDEREAKIREANLVQAKASELKREAVTSFNMAKNLEDVAELKQKDADDAENFASNFEKQITDPEEMSKNLTANRQTYIDNQKKYIGVGTEIERRQTQRNEMQEDLKKSIARSNELDSELKEASKNIQSIKQQLDNGEGDKQVLTTQLNDAVEKYKEVNKERIIQTRKRRESELEFSNITTEIAFLEKLIEEVKTNDETPDEIAGKASEVDKQKLDKEIYDKELAADVVFAEEVNKVQADELKAEETFFEELKEYVPDITPSLTLAEYTPDSDPNNKSADIIKDIDIEKLAVESFENPEAKKLVQQAKEDNTIVKSLETQIKNKEAKINEVQRSANSSTDAQEKEQAANEVASLKTEIKDLESFVRVRKKQAEENLQAAIEKEGISSSSSILADATYKTPDGTTPDGTTPDGTTPDGTTPDGTTPDGTTPDGTTPDGTTPDGTTPDGTTPDGTTPDGTTPDGRTPDGRTPDGTTPDGTTPDGTTPDGTTPDGTTPDGTTPDRRTPDGTTPDGTTPDGTTPDGTTPDGRTPDGTNPYGTTPDIESIDEKDAQPIYEEAINEAKRFELLFTDAQKEYDILKADFENANVDEKEEIKAQLLELAKEIVVNNIKASKEYLFAADLRMNFQATITDSKIDIDDLITKSLNFKTVTEPPVSNDQVARLESIKTETAIAEDHKKNYDGHLENISVLKESINENTSSSEELKINKEIRDIEKLAEDEFENYNQAYSIANLEEYEIINVQLDRTRRQGNDPILAQALELENNAVENFEKAKYIRRNALFIEDFETRTKELINAKNLESISISKEKQALNLYLIAQEEKVGIVAEPLVVADINKSSFSLPKEKIEVYKNKVAEAKTLEQDANVLMKEVLAAREEAENVFSEKDKENILSTVRKKESKALESRIAAYEIHRSADSLKYKVFSDQLDTLMTTLTDIGDNKDVASQYMRSSNYYYEEAQKLFAESEKIPAENIIEKERIARRAKNFEKMALSRQELAIDILMEPKAVTFWEENPLVIIKRNEDVIKEVDVKVLAEKQRALIYQKVDLDEYDKKVADEAVLAAKEGNAYIGEADKIKIQIQELTELANTSDDSKEVKKALKTIPKLEKRVNDLAFAFQQAYENSNDALYWVNKENFKKVRSTSTPENSAEAKKIENAANKRYREAKILRDKAFNIKDNVKAYAMIDKARILENQTLKEQYKAYALYLEMPTLEEDSVRAAIALLEVGINENDIISSNVNITPITEDGDTSNLAYAETTDPIETDPIETDPIEIDPVETDPIETDPVETDPVETDPVETDPVEIDPVETDPVETDPVETDPVETDPVETDPVETDPIETDPVETDPIETDPIETDPIETDPIDKDPVVIPPITEDVPPEIKIVEDNDPQQDDYSSDELAKIIDKLIADGYGMTYDRKIRYSESNPIPMNVPCTDNSTTFKVQIGAYKNPINPGIFNGVAPLEAEKFSSSQLTKFMVGLFKTYIGARYALDEIRGRGFNDAFIAVYKDCKRVSNSDATRILREAREKDYGMIATAEEEMRKNKNKYADRIAANAAELTKKFGSYDPQDGTAAGQVYTNAENIASVKGLYYTVQIGVYRKTVTKEQLYNLDPIYKNKIHDQMVRYSTGIYNDLAEVTRQRDRIRAIGITDAFVTAYVNGERITISEAQVIAEREGSEIFAKEVQITGGFAAQAPDVVVYKVQIGAYSNQVPTEVVNSFLSITDQKIEQKRNEDGVTLYSVGNYSSYGEATTRKDVLVNSGIIDAFVVAYKGGERLSIDEARRLTE